MKILTLCVAACFILSGVALAQKPVEPDLPKGSDRLDCITEGYDAYLGGAGGAIPDDDTLGVYFGPMPTAGTNPIEDVILYVNMSATWIGDVRLSLLYDVDCDGIPEAEGSVLCRHTLDGCPTEDCCGCSGDLAGWYGFDDTAASIEDQCITTFPPGCYGQDYDSTGLDVFDDERSSTTL